MTFITQLLIFSAVTVVSTFPLAYVCKIHQRRHDPRKSVRAALIVSFLAAGLAWTSRNLQDSCKAERNEGCFDGGGVLTGILLVGGFVAWALISAYLKHND